jgi:hypothetical protein
MPEIEIRRTHPDAVKGKKYGDSGLVSVSRQTETITKIRLPDVSGEYEIEELGTIIAVDMSDAGNGGNDRHVRLESNLIGGERDIFIASQFDTGREQLDSETELVVRVPSTPRDDPKYRGRLW